MYGNVNRTRSHSMLCRAPYSVWLLARIRRSQALTDFPASYFLSPILKAVCARTIQIRAPSKNDTLQFYDLSADSSPVSICFSTQQTHSPEPNHHPHPSPLPPAPNPRREASWQLPAADGAQASVAVEQKVREVGISTYDGALEGAGETLVVLDLYTQW